MKKIPFLLIGIFSFISISLAAEQDVVQPVQGVQIDERVVPPPDVTPRWESSLGGIESTTRALLETNTKLSDEYHLLKDQLITLEAEYAGQIMRNQGLQQEVVEKKMDSTDVADKDRLRAEIDFTDKAIAQKKQEMAALQAKLQTVDGRLSLRKLKVKELELEKKTALLERRPQEDADIAEVRRELQGLRERLDAIRDQEAGIKQKIDALDPAKYPYAGEARQVVGEIRTMEQSLEALEVEKANFLKKLNAPSSDPTLTQVRRYQALVIQKQDLEAERAKMREDKLAGAGLEMPGEDLPAQIKKLDADNKTLETEVNNLRENIAVLEYKISTIERYKGRK